MVHTVHSYNYTACFCCFFFFFFFFNVGEIFKKTLEGWLSASSYPGAPVPHLRTETPVCSFWAICPSVLPSYLVPSPKTTPSDVFSLEITIESPGPQPQSHVPLPCNSWRLQRFAFLGGGGVDLHGEVADGSPCSFIHMFLGLSLAGSRSAPVLPSTVWISPLDLFHLPL